MNLLGKKPPSVEDYRRLRQIGKELISKMYQAASGPSYDIIKAARKLTIPTEGRTLIFDGETDTTALADFYLHELYFGGKRIVDLLAESDANLTPEERELLEAHRRARCSLFTIVSLDPHACHVRLRDILEPGAPEVVLTDINLSRSPVQPGHLLFTRVLECGGLQISSGLFFGFLSVHRVHLLNAYQARMRTVDRKERAQRTYVFFYQKHRELGGEQAFEDVT